MDIKEINNKDIWENFLAGCPQKTFLQSWNWGEFQEKMGNKIWRLGIYEEGNLISAALVSKVTARRGVFLLVQHGPIFNFKFPIFKQIPNSKFQVLEKLLSELKKIGEREEVSFVRVAPLLLRNLENEKIFNDLGFKKAPMHANAYEATWKLDISVPEEDLMKNMRKTTRYLIRQSMKSQDVSIEKSRDINDLEIYQNLNKQVAARQNFVPFSDKFIRNEFEIFAKDDQCLLFFGKHKGEIAAGSLIIFWQKIAFYHQAASISKYSRFSIPYLLQWEAIKEAKARGCEIYDFWGFTDPQKYPKHPWAGPTLFKMGFGGYNEEYVKTQDFPISNKYWLTYIFEKSRTIKRFGL